MIQRHCDTNLTETQWALLEKLLPQPQKQDGTPLTKGGLMGAILQIICTGGQ